MFIIYNPLIFGNTILSYYKLNSSNKRLSQYNNKKDDRLLRLPSFLINKLSNFNLTSLHLIFQHL